MAESEKWRAMDGVACQITDGVWGQQWRVTHTAKGKEPAVKGTRQLTTEAVTKRTLPYTGT